MSEKKTILRKVSLGLWLLLVIVGLTYFFLNPDQFTAENIALQLQRFNTELIIIYLLVSIIRGFFLFPSTPLIIAGTLMFPEQPLMVVFISILGIVISSGLIYFFSDYWGFNDFFEKRYPDKIENIRKRLEKPTGILFIVGWSFFPVVPTDLVSYIAGSMKMNFWKFIGAVFIGELILCFACVYGGQYFLHG